MPSIPNGYYRLEPDEVLLEGDMGNWFDSPFDDIRFWWTISRQSAGVRSRIYSSEVHIRKSESQFGNIFD